MLKHIICHIHTLDHPAVLKLLEALVKHNKLFTGEKIATITKVNPEAQIHYLTKKILETLGFKVITVENDELRETAHFFNTSLPYLLSKSREGVVYYCHSKGVTYHPDSNDGIATALWTDVLIHNTLSLVDSIPFANKKYKTFGTGRVSKKGFLPDNIGEAYTFVGTFYWIKLEALAGKVFKPTSKFYLEALPGLVSTVSESFNQGPTFLPEESPYNLEVWKKKGLYND